MKKMLAFNNKVELLKSPFSCSYFWSCSFEENSDQERGQYIAPHRDQKFDGTISS